MEFYVLNRKEKASIRLKNLVESKGGILLEKYTNADTKIFIKCSRGHVWEQYPNAIVNENFWCKECRWLDFLQQVENDVINESILNPKEKAYLKFYKLVKSNNGKILGEYKDTQTPVSLKCSNDHEFTLYPGTATFNRSWCISCYYNFDENKVEFEQIVYKQKGKIIGEYIGWSHNILLECEFGHRWNPRPINVKNGTWCKTCNESHLERDTKLILEEFNISYIREYVIDELPKKRYDFLINYNNQNIIIELDGQQHFEYCEYFDKSPEYFEKRKNSDRLKMRIAYKYGYKVIRIDYTEIQNIRQHLINGINCNHWIYLSCPYKYNYIFDNIPIDYIIKNSTFLTHLFGTK